MVTLRSEGIMKVYLDGDLLDEKEAKISVFDHGFLYGDGAFEGVRAYNGNVFKLQEHIDRLYETCHSLLITCSLTKNEMTHAVIDILKVNNLQDAYIRIIVTRGKGDLGLDIRKCRGKSSVVIITDDISLYPEELYKEGMKIITVATLQCNSNALNPQLKSLNYLNNIMAKIEAANAGYNEAIMMDQNGFITECTGDNIFIIKGEVLLTPVQGHLKGITRQTILDIAKKCKMEIKESFITRHEVYTADECFLTGTAAEIIPIVEVDGRKIRLGKVGLKTRDFMMRFKNEIKKKGTSIR